MDKINEAYNVEIAQEEGSYMLSCPTENVGPCTVTKLKNGEEISKETEQYLNKEGYYFFNVGLYVLFSAA